MHVDFCTVYLEEQRSSSLFLDILISRGKHVDCSKDKRSPQTVCDRRSPIGQQDQRIEFILVKAKTSVHIIRVVPRGIFSASASNRSFTSCSQIYPPRAGDLLLLWSHSTHNIYSCKQSVVLNTRMVSKIPWLNHIIFPVEPPWNPWPSHWPSRVRRPSRAYHSATDSG